jgi:hypothetical protein
MMAHVQPFYLSDGPGRFLSTPSSAGPWGADSQHGGCRLYTTDAADE